LQRYRKSKKGTLIRIDVKAGHGAGKSVAASIQENEYQAFTLWVSKHCQN
jgi:prolyl oligopeptidase